MDRPDPPPVSKTRDPLEHGPMESQNPRTGAPAAEWSDEKSERTRLLLVDDHQAMRDTLKRLMQGQPNIEVIGEAANGLEALELAHRLRPEVVIMDISMPVMDGIEATRRLKTELSGIGVIGLSMYEDELAGIAMRNAGADRYLNKTASFSELLRAIRGIARG